MSRFSIVRCAGVVIALFLSLAVARPVSAQALDSSQAADFLGSWSITIQSPDGAVPFLLNLVDKEGKLEASIGMAGGESMVIQNVTRSGDDLVARYTMPYEGMDLPVVMTIRREGEGLQTSWDFMEGAFTTTAAGTRQ
jgi:hypothetical protein